MEDVGWFRVSPPPPRGVTIYATLLGSPTRSLRNVDLQSLLIWGLGQFRVVPSVRAGLDYAEARTGYGRAPLALVAAKPLLSVARVGRPLTEKVVAPVVVALPVRRGQVFGAIEVWEGGRLLGRRDLVASRTINKPGLGGRLGWYAGRTLHHLAHFL
jgi:serine-type D-Ala-D-Ala carboxypeptidase (penicillin-binding protein 5/6)